MSGQLDGRVGHALQIDPRPLSSGRDFEVFGAELDGRRVAVKVVRPGAEAREADLIVEARALEKLAATGVVPRLVAMTRLPAGRLALVREWIEGTSLAAVIERALVRHRWQGARRWNAPTRAIVGAVLDAVERVHDAGWVHNDLKPDDILLRIQPGGGFEVKLIDLGLASRPKQGGPGGTVAYAAPERLEGEPGTVRSDVWSLGAILFELCAGTRAYPADQPVDARLERRYPVQRSPREGAALAWRHLPPELQAGVAGALAAEPNARTKSVAVLRKALRLSQESGWRGEGPSKLGPYSGSAFGGGATVGGSELGGRATAGGSELGGRATAGGSELGGRATVGGSELGGRATVGGSAFGGGATVGGSALGGGATVGGSALGGGATVGGSELGGGATVGGSAFGGGATVGASAFRGSLVGGDAQTNAGFPVGAELARPSSRHFLPVFIAAAVATVLAVVIAWGPMSRALGLDRRDTPAACEAMRLRAEGLCRGLSGEAACRAALTATDDCVARAELLGACEGP